MSDYQHDTYGERVAGVYDDWYKESDPDMIEVLASLAGKGPALELGIGTGRVALPLAQRGVQVHGIDASPSMLARLREKPGAADIPVALGDFSKAEAEGKFSLVYVVANTFFGLLSQEEQVSCFQNVASRLSEGGVFLIEAFVLDVSRFSHHQATLTNRVGVDEVALDASRHNPIEQTITSQHVRITQEGIKMYPVRLRYAWPSELDLMARLAGLRRLQRWSNWKRAPFQAGSGGHISMYGV